MNQKDAVSEQVSLEGTGSQGIIGLTNFRRKVCRQKVCSNIIRIKLVIPSSRLKDSISRDMLGYFSGVTSDRKVKGVMSSASVSKTRTFKVVTLTYQITQHTFKPRLMNNARDKS